MKITLTGSLGHIGKPLTQKLIEKEHTVTVISSNPERSREIEGSGAIPAIGTLQDVNFLASSFKGAEAVYTMVPPANYFDHDLDLPGYYQELANNYAEAIRRAEIQRIVNLSSIGAHLDKGNGILSGTYHVENILNNLPEEVAITHIRPTEFYYNLFGFIDLIKSQGIMAGNLEESDLNVWVSPKDIAACVAEEISAPSSGRKVRYVASDELTYKEVAGILGSTIGKPELKWVMIPDDHLLQRLESAGMQPEIARGMVEMYAAIHSGLLYEDYNLHKPETFGQVKMKDFAKEFAAVFNAK